MKRILATFLAVYIAVYTPWRLTALFAESFFLKPGLTRVVQTNGDYWEVARLQDRIEQLGYTVSYEKELRAGNLFMSIPVYGMTMKGEGRNSIKVESGLSWDSRYSVLAHEGGHIFQSERYSEAEGEVFAEAVAMLVTNDGIREHARYLSTKKLALFTILMLDSAKVYRAAAVLQE